MRKFLFLVTARSKEFYRDKATLLWTFIFPFIVLLGFAYGYSGREEPLFKVGVVEGSESGLVGIHEFLAIPELQVVKYASLEEALRKVERHQLDMLLAGESLKRETKVTFWVNPGSTKSALPERLLRSSVVPGVSLVKKEVSGRKIRYADWLVPGLIGMNLMFGSLFGVGYVIVRYRKNGVLKRLRATPLSAFEFLTAQVVSRMLVLLATSLITLGGAVLLIGFPMEGSIFDFLVFLAVGSASLIALGMVIAARISSEEVADGVLNVMTWPMIFLSGIWFSLEGASEWVQGFAKLLPLTHVVAGLRAIMIEGQGLASLAPQMLVLAIASLVLLSLGSLIFKWR